MIIMSEEFKMLLNEYVELSFANKQLKNINSRLQDKIKQQTDKINKSTTKGGVLTIIKPSTNR
jgi:hypothetical protein